VNGARWLREKHDETRALPDVVRLQAERWLTEPAPARAALQSVS
jgi:hypothetical protein